MSSEAPAVREFVEGVSSHMNAGRSLPDSVTEMLPRLLLREGMLTAEHRRPAATGYARHPLFRHPKGLYSIQVMVFNPGQSTPIHDHCSWCIVGVLEGEERETLYAPHCQKGDRVVPLATRVMRRGEICCHLPDRPNIHRVENAGVGVSISLHVYGFDSGMVNSSIARCYEV